LRVLGAKQLHQSTVHARLAAVFDAPAFAVDDRPGRDIRHDPESVVASADEAVHGGKTSEFVLARRRTEELNPGPTGRVSVTVSLDSLIQRVNASRHVAARLEVVVAQD